MNKLLSAIFLRLWKNKLFWFAIIFMFIAGSSFVFKSYEQLVDYGISIVLEQIFFRYCLMMCMVSAIFCPLFLGVEYSDGTMRNKIIIGHKRAHIYFSNLIVTVSASLLFCLSYILSNIIFGIPLIGFQYAKLPAILLTIGGSAVTVVALCSLFTMISLLVPNKALASVICIVGIFLMMVLTAEYSRMLGQPKYHYEDVPNVNYLDGAFRREIQFYHNFLPSGQEIQYTAMKTDYTADMCLYSIGIVIATSGIGIFFFKRKNIN